MLTCQKHLFSLPDDIAYLNCAYMAPLPESVELAGYEGVAKKALPYEIGRPDFFEPVIRLKQLFARLIHVEDAERIAIVPSVSYGMANVVKNVKLSPGQNIVLADEIFPSNYYPWKRLADDSGATVKVVKPPTKFAGRGQAWNEKILEAIDPQTALVALPHTHWADGTVFDLRAVRQATRRVGGLLIVDGTQSVGARPFDVREIQPDALICAGYKWLLGPYGIGLAYYGEHFDQGAPIEENWINRVDSDNFEGLVNYQSAYRPGAHRYSVGENSQFIAVPMLSTAIELILGWGVDNIQEYCRRLSEPYLQRLAAMGYRIENPDYRSGHLFGVRLPDEVSIENLKEEAAARNVYVSFRGDAVRISPNVYNEPEDFEQLEEVFRACL